MTRVDPAGTEPSSDVVDVNQDFTELDQILSDHISRALHEVPLETRTGAPVIMPSQEDIAVRLVPAHKLERLYEADSDQNRAAAVMWAAVGALLGIVTNLVFSEEAPNPWVIALTAILATVTVGATWLTVVYGRRAGVIRASVMGGGS